MATARRIYDNMVYIRVLDERMIAAQRQGRISFYMTCIGEEAAIIASAVAIDDQDMVFAQYREQGALRARGFTTEQFMNQNFSNEMDLGKGRRPGMLVMGAEDPHMFGPQQGTDLLAFFTGVFERTMRRWLS